MLHLEIDRRCAFYDYQMGRMKVWECVKTDIALAVVELTACKESFWVDRFDASNGRHDQK